jgi:hypothetical protein
VVRRRGSATGHGWRWPAVRPVPALGKMEEEDGGGGRTEGGRRRTMTAARGRKTMRGRWRGVGGLAH